LILILIVNFYLGKIKPVAMKRILLPLIIISLIAAIVEAQTPKLNLVVFATGFSNPVDIANCGDSRLFVVERAGKIIIVDSNGIKNTTPFLNISSRVNSGSSEQGLLGLAFHPQYISNGYFYVNYITGSGNGYTCISRFTRDSTNANLADPNSEIVLLQFKQPYTNHNGGALKFGSDGYLYDSQGDGGSGGDPGNRAQQKDSLFGKILRIDVNAGNPYAIPPDNPFVNGGGKKEVWAIGLRNPWRFSFDKLTGDLWIGDVGQGNYEEIDFQKAGSAGGVNYGWKCYEGFHAYSAGSCPGGTAGLTSPVWEYSHSLGCSVTGGFVYRGTQSANLFGGYLYTDYCSGRIWMLKPDNLGGFVNTDLGLFATNNYSSFGEDINGELYLAELKGGRVMKITDTSDCKPVAWITSGDTLTKCTATPSELQVYQGVGLNYQWNKDGNDIPGATNATHQATETGNYAVRVTKINASGCTNLSNTVTVRNHPETVIEFMLPSSGTVPGEFCSNSSDRFILNATPASGVFSGDGVSGDTLMPYLFTKDTSIITYTYKDSNACVKSVTDTAIIVHPQIAPVITLPGNGLKKNLFCSNFPDKYVLTAAPSGGTFSGEYMNGDTLDTFSVPENDTSLITYSYTDSNGCQSTVTDTVYFSICTAFSLMDKAQNIKAYPNPSSGIIHINLFSVQQKNSEIRILNGLGKLVYEKQAVIIKGVNHFILDVSKHPDGFYLLQLISDTGNNSARIMIVKSSLN